MVPTWEAHRDAWEGFARNQDPPVERVAIPYEDTELEGWLFRSTTGTAPRPLLILNNGSDGPVSAMWLQGAAGALARGYDCLTFDGPGQGAALWRQSLYFRPDWEAVIEPVVDFALEIDGIDPERIALLGVSQAGYWVPRAVAFEKRIAAAVADPGVWDVGRSWHDHVPKSMLKHLDAGERDKFNRGMEWGARLSKSARGTLAFRTRPFGKETPYDVYEALREYTLDGVAEKIECPILITDPDHEQFWPGDAEKLYDAVSTPAAKKRVVPLHRAGGRRLALRATCARAPRPARLRLARRDPRLSSRARRPVVAAQRRQVANLSPLTSRARKENFRRPQSAFAVGWPLQPWRRSSQSKPLPFVRVMSRRER